MKLLLSLLSQLSPVLLLLFGANAIAQDQDLEEFVDAWAAEHVGESLAGLSVGVSRAGEVILNKSYGLANIEWQVPMPLNAVHEVGSVTKQFTAVALLQLYGQERLDFDAHINEYLPEFDTQGRRVTVRQLVDHTSGIKGFTELEAFRDLSTQSAPLENLYELIENAPFDFEPGEAMIYNNSGYFLMGQIVEAITGQSYADYLAEHVFPAAGMENSSYCSNSRIEANKASGYSRGEEGFTIARYHDHTWPYAAGSVCSTVADLLKWNHAIHHGQVLSPTLYDLFITPVPLNDGSEIQYAMGINNYLHPTGRVIEHGGAIDGFLSHSRYYPEEDVAIVVLQNTTAAPGPSTTANEIGEFLFGSPYMPEAKPFEGDLARYEGSYRGAARGFEMGVRVFEEDDSLKVAVTAFGEERPAETIAYLEDDTFFAGPNRFIFRTNGNGEVSELHLASWSSHYVLKAVDD